MNRRGFLKSILAAGVAPYVVTTAGVLMPVRQIARIDDPVIWRGIVAEPYPVYTISKEKLAHQFWGVSRIAMPDHIDNQRLLNQLYRNLLTPA